MTQNQNESINGTLWRRCPKNKFCGKQKLELAVSETVSEFNRGAISSVTLQEDLGVHVSHNNIKSATKIDATRIENAARKISEKARLVRRKARAKQKGQQDTCKGKESYQTGAFGLSKNPENLTEKTKPTKQRKDTVNFCENITITFVSDFSVIVMLSNDNMCDNCKLDIESLLLFEVMNIMYLDEFIPSQAHF